ncbi:MAG: hypothetical protein GYA24_05275, partial [Candidatus Lokiarchaeota archaeon]|nr:hypothetical protein [Candidatus Lokiarchaeota archaeon]
HVAASTDASTGAVNASAGAGTTASEPSGATSAAGTTEQVAPGEIRPPRFYFTELLTNFKAFFTKATRFQRRGVLFCAILYFSMLSPIALMPLGSAFFTPIIVWITWGSYVGFAAVVGSIAISYAIKYVTTHDMREIYGQHLKEVTRRNMI